MNTITVARGIIYINDKLLVVQNKRLAANQWCLPGGKIDSNETPVEAMQRELIEETGIKGKIGKLAYVHQLFMNRGGDAAQRLEFFFIIDNPEDFLAADIAKTTHGLLEMNDMAFKRIDEVELLPSFLTEELKAGLVIGGDVKFVKNYC
ncbi:MAG TPA: NUDIX hydrolase [Candidatus Saccharimonadales bacterium]|nr:NUDIX hydrolase [Candidatus Saccharimonadales bacterium]